MKKKPSKKMEVRVDKARLTQQELQGVKQGFYSARMQVGSQKSHTLIPKRKEHKDHETTLASKQTAASRLQQTITKDSKYDVQKIQRARLINVEDMFNYLDLDNLKDELEGMTTDMVTTIKSKLLKIQEDYQAVLDRRQQLTITYGRLKGETQVLSALNRESHESLMRVNFSNQQLSDDSADLSQQLTLTSRRISSIARESGSTIDSLTQERDRLIGENNLKKVALAQEREQWQTRQRALEHNLETAEAELYEINTELADLHKKLNAVQTKEGKRRDNFFNKTQTLDVSVSVLKAMSKSASKITIAPSLLLSSPH